MPRLVQLAHSLDFDLANALAGDGERELLRRAKSLYRKYRRDYLTTVEVLESIPPPANHGISVGQVGSRAYQIPWTDREFLQREGILPGRPTLD